MSEELKEFNVNKYITLKLKYGETIIYVNNERFDQCKFLLLDIPIDEIRSFDKIQSIDEASEKLDNSLEPFQDEHGFLRRRTQIPPEVEFWGHCSNIQVWAENNYDTRLIHRNLAFPLLKKLTEVGDPIAKRVLKEEIAKRFMSYHLPVVKYLLDEKYLYFLESQEIQSLSLDSERRLKEIFLKSLRKSHIMKNIVLPILKNLIDLGFIWAKDFLKDVIIKMWNYPIIEIDIRGFKKLLFREYFNYFDANLKKSLLKEKSISEDLAKIVEFRNAQIPKYEVDPLIDLENQMYIATWQEYCEFKLINEIDYIPGEDDFGPQEFILPNSWNNAMFSVKNNRVEGIFLHDPNVCEYCYNEETEWTPSAEDCKKCGIRDVPRSLSMLRYLKKFLIIGRYSYGKAIFLPKYMNSLSSLETLLLNGSYLIDLSEFLCCFKNLRTLDLSETQLEKFPQFIDNLSMLQNLILRRNKLTFIPKSIEKLECLQILILGENELDSLPKEISNLKNLSFLDLRYNKFNNLPESICNLSSLQELDLRGNKLNSLSESIKKLKSLKKLNLEYNKLTSLPKSLAMIDSLQILLLNGNKIETVPKILEQKLFGAYIVDPEELNAIRKFEFILKYPRYAIVRDKHVVELTIYDEGLTMLPDSIGKLKHLQKFSIGGESLIELPESIGKLSSLQILEIRPNKINSLPESIGNLKYLEKLSITVNNITEIPESIGKLKNLKELQLSRNQITYLPETIGNLKSLEILNLNDNSLSSFPHSIYKLTFLENLTLNNNKLKSIPKSIGNLKSLKRLELKNNKIAIFPEFLRRLDSLNFLELSENRIKSIPDSIGYLDSLEYLILDNNQIKSIPESIGNLKSLKSLGLNGNQISVFPETILDLEFLEYLSLKRNQLETIPETLLQKLKRLQWIDIRENDSLQLPELFKKKMEEEKDSFWSFRKFKNWD